MSVIIPSIFCLVGYLVDIITCQAPEREEIDTDYCTNRIRFMRSLVIDFTVLIFNSPQKMGNLK